MAEAIRQENMMQEGADQKASSNRISTFLLFATVAAAPLPFGSTNPPAIAFWCIVLGIAAIVASPRGLRGGQFALLGLAAIVIAAYGLVLHEQLATTPVVRNTRSALARNLQGSRHADRAVSVNCAQSTFFCAWGVLSRHACLDL